MSQSDLARKIGVAFQQVQKYEKGTNRVGAGRLSRIAAALGVSIGELFENPGSKSPDSQSPIKLLAQPDALRILKAFSRLSDPRVRRAMAQLVETVADQQPEEKLSTLRHSAKRGISRQG